jgi:hypothetical protein
MLSLQSKLEENQREGEKLRIKLGKLKFRTALYVWSAHSKFNPRLGYIDKNRVNYLAAKYIANNPIEFEIKAERFLNLLGDLELRECGIPQTRKLSEETKKEFLNHPEKYLPILLNVRREETMEKLLEIRLQNGPLIRAAKKSCVVEKMWHGTEMMEDIAGMIINYFEDSEHFRRESNIPGKYRVIITPEGFYDVKKDPPFWIFYLLLGLGLQYQTTEILVKQTSELAINPGFIEGGSEDDYDPEENPVKIVDKRKPKAKARRGFADFYDSSSSEETPTPKRRSSKAKAKRAVVTEDSDEEEEKPVPKLHSQAKAISWPPYWDD